jgi:putative oxidoreductase
MPSETRPVPATNVLHRACAALAASALWLQSLFLLGVRLYWGWQFAQTGWGKLHHLERVTAFFASLGIPFPGLNAPFVATLEFAGGILLMLGLGLRPVALLLAVDMAVAYAAADREALLAVFSDPGKFYAAAPYTFLFASVIVVLFGGGVFSLDRLIARRWWRLSGGTASPR